jgi:hypothetical protein
LGRWSLLPVGRSVGLVCEAVPGRGEVPCVDESPIAMVGDIVVFKEGEDSSAVLVISSMVAEEWFARCARAVAWWAKLSSRMMGRGLPGVKARGSSPRILSRRRRAVACEYWVQSQVFAAPRSS